MGINKKVINLFITIDTLNIGGKEVLLTNILKNIDKTKFEIHLAVLSGKGVLLKETYRYVKNIVPLSRTHKLDIRTILSLRKYIMKNKIDIIHTNGWIDSLYILLATWGIPVIRVATVHGYEKGWRLFIHKKTLAQFKYIIAVSNSSLKKLINMGYYNSNMYVVYNCYDNERFKPMNRLQSNSPPRLAMVSRFDWCKQQDVVVKAVGVLKERSIEVTMDFIGDGENKYVKPVKELASKINMTKAINFLGTVKDVKNFLPNYDIFIISSFADTFALSLVEAIGVGLPVIASDIGPFKEILGDNEYGFLFKTGDENSLADRIEMLIKNKSLYKEMSIKSRKRAGDFTPQNTVRKLEEIYGFFYNKYQKSH